MWSGCATPTAAPTCCRWARARWPGCRTRSTDSTWPSCWRSMACAPTASTPWPTATSPWRPPRRWRWCRRTSRAWPRSGYCGRAANSGSSRSMRPTPPAARSCPRNATPISPSCSAARPAAYGHLLALLTLLKGLPLAYNKDLQEDKPALFDAVDTVLASTRIAAELVAATTFHRARLAAAAAADFSTATDLADHLARRGVPFREAHRVVGELVRYCLAAGRTLPDLSLDELRRFSPHFTAEAVGVGAAQPWPPGTYRAGRPPARAAAARADRG